MEISRSKVVSLLLCLALVIGLVWAGIPTGALSAQAAPGEEFAGGNGSGASPWLISTPEQLAAVGSYVGAANEDKHFKLTRNINLTEFLQGAGNNAGKGWKPIGSGSQFGAFFGSLDGAGYTILGLWSNRPFEDYVGLFNRIGATTGRVENLGILLDNSKGGIKASSWAGGVAGYLSGTVKSCYVKGDVSTVYGYAGGIAGTQYSGLIETSFAQGNVRASNSAGGLVGSASAHIKNCYAQSDVQASTNVGGLIGRANAGSVKNCYAAGRATGAPSSTGGIIGYVTGATFSRCYYDKEVSSLTKGRGNASDLSSMVAGKTTAQMKTAATFVDWAFAGSDAVWEITQGATYPQLKMLEHIEEPPDETDFDSGSGKQNDPWIIRTPQQLAALNKYLGELGVDKYWELGNDIDLTAYLAASESGWQPIGSNEGNSEATRFAGNIDGKGFEVTGLWINRTEQDNAGLFGAYGAEGSLKNLGVKTDNAKGGVSARAWVGALIGESYAKVQNCYAVGKVYGEDVAIGGLIGYSYSNVGSGCYANCEVSGKSFVGGLIGAAENISITNCNAQGKVTCKEESVGGLVGIAQEAITIKGSHALADVTGANYVGGLIGYMHENSIISDCYAGGDAKGNDNVGGLIGGVGEGGSITNSHATGEATGNENVGGLVGYAYDNCVISSCHAQANVQGNSDVGGLMGGIGAGGSVTNSYATGKVTGTDYVGGLVGYAYDNSTISGCYALGDVQGNENVGGLMGGIGAGSNINDSHATGRVTGTDYVGGLVGDTYKANSISNCNATGDVHGNSNVGGLAGHLGDGARVERCFATGNVSGEGDFVSSFIAGAAGGVSIANSYSTGNASGHNRVGGLVGMMGIDGSITESYAQGNMTGNDDVGGLAGSIGENSSITNSHAKGKVTGTNFVGGLVGDTYKANSISNCNATGDVRGNSNVGGLAGHLGDATRVERSFASGNVSGEGDFVSSLIGGAAGGVSIANSYSTGNASGHNRVGGLVGMMGIGGSITESYAQGNMTGNDDVGGLAGHLGDAARVERSFALADITGHANVGGFVGTGSADTQINNCYAAGKVSAQDCVGGFIGYFYTGAIENCYAAGKVTGATDHGGFAGLKYHAESTHFTSCYYSQQLSGQSAGVGASITQRETVPVDQVGKIESKTPAQMMQQATFAGWSFDKDTWAIQPGQTFPYFTWQTQAGLSNDYTPSGMVCQYGGGILGLEFIDHVATQSLTGANTVATLQATPPPEGKVTILDMPELTDINKKYTGYIFGISQSGIISPYIVDITRNNLHDFDSGSGIEDDPWIIRTPQQLAALNKYLGELGVDKYWELGNNIDLTAYLGASESGWQPIGSNEGDLEAARFAGNIDGKGFEVTGLWINRTGQDNVGLFGGYGAKGSLKNLRVKANDTKGGVAGRSDVGMLIGINFAQVTNCYALADVSGKDYVGGLVGRIGAESSITNSYAQGNVDASNYVGGLAGAIGSASHIENCHATCDVNGGLYVGGLIGDVGNYSTITDSYATGDTKGDSYTGGLVGDLGSYSSTQRCYAQGDVSGNLNVGGLTGVLGYFSSIELCYAQGNVHAQGLAGGFIGAGMFGTQIRNCYAAGNTSAKDSAGGFIGYHYDGSIENCYAAGKVTATEDPATGGGFAGLKYDDASTFFTSCYYSQQLSGQPTGVGGLTSEEDSIGTYPDKSGVIESKTPAQMMQQATFANWTFNDEVWAIKERATFPYFAWQAQGELSNDYIPSGIACQYGDFRVVFEFINHVATQNLMGENKVATLQATPPPEGKVRILNMPELTEPNKKYTGYIFGISQSGIISPYIVDITRNKVVAN